MSDSSQFFTQEINRMGFNFLGMIPNLSTIITAIVLIGTIGGLCFTYRRVISEIFRGYSELYSIKRVPPVTQAEKDNAKAGQELIEAIDKCGFVFWTCPNKCNSYVDWNEDTTQATCRECGKLSTDP